MYRIDDWWESRRPREQIALKKNYKAQTGNIFSLQKLYELFELETWDLTNVGLKDFSFITDFVRIKRLIVNKNTLLKSFDGFEQSPTIAYLECWDTSLKCEPILNKCRALKVIMFEKNEQGNLDYWMKQHKTRTKNAFHDLPTLLLTCFFVNSALAEKGINCKNVTNIYDSYAMYFGFEVQLPAVEDLPYAAFSALTHLVVQIKDESKAIEDLDWLSLFPNLQYLDCSNQLLTSLSGIENCPDLQILNCQHNQISNIDAIAECRRLHTFNCSHNKTYYMDAILAHSGLRKVDVVENPIIKRRLMIPVYRDTQSKAAYYDSLPSLFKIKLAQHYTEKGYFEPKEDEFFVPYELIKTFKAVDISLLLDKNFPASLDSLEWLAIYDDLEYLNCRANYIEDLTPLRFCPNLKSLISSSNEIKDFSPINDLKQLETFYFSNNPVIDISNVQILPQLKSCQWIDAPLNNRSQIALAYNKINIDWAEFINLLEPLLTEHEMQLILMNYYFHQRKIAIPMNSDWRNINQIFTQITGKKNISHHILEDITNIRDMKIININNYQAEQLTNLSLLQGLTNLQELDCCFNHLPNFEGLEQAIDLRQIDAAFNALKSLQGLQNCHKLQSLNLQNNPIKDLSLLVHCKNLRIIHLNYTLTDSLRDLDELNNLELLYIGDTQVSDHEISRFARLHPDCVINNTL